MITLLTYNHSFDRWLKGKETSFIWLSLLIILGSGCVVGGSLYGIISNEGIYTGFGGIFIIDVIYFCCRRNKPSVHKTSEIVSSSITVPPDPGVDKEELRQLYYKVMLALPSIYSYRKDNKNLLNEITAIWISKELNVTIIQCYNFINTNYYFLQGEIWQSCSDKKGGTLTCINEKGEKTQAFYWVISFQEFNLYHYNNCNCSPEYLVKYDHDTEYVFENILPMILNKKNAAEKYPMKKIDEGTNEQLPAALLPIISEYINYDSPNFEDILFYIIDSNKEEYIKNLDGALPLFPKDLLPIIADYNKISLHETAVLDQAN